MSTSPGPSQGLTMTTVALSSSPHQGARSRTTVRIHNKSSCRERASSLPLLALPRLATSGAGVVLTPSPCAGNDIATQPLLVSVVSVLPGDTWSERNGYVFINGTKLNEPCINPLFRDHLSYRPRTIPAGDYLMMGDNRAGACDSRRFGVVPFADLVSRVVQIKRPNVQNAEADGYSVSAGATRDEGAGE